LEAGHAHRRLHAPVDVDALFELAAGAVISAVAVFIVVAGSHRAVIVRVRIAPIVLLPFVGVAEGVDVGAVVVVGVGTLVLARVARDRVADDAAENDAADRRRGSAPKPVPTATSTSLQRLP
jgi:hypothetical protein